MPRSQKAARIARMGDAGYSLLEILIVLAIIALIAALVGPRLFAQFSKSKVTTARVQTKQLVSALSTLQLDLGRFPTQQEGLGLLTKPPAEGAQGWQGPYLSGDLPKDPWGHDYIYAPPADDTAEPKVSSYGADGKPGGTGLAADVSS